MGLGQRKGLEERESEEPAETSEAGREGERSVARKKTDGGSLEAGAAMATNTRNARRRRILQSSEDRLALITGRASNLPASQSDIPDLFDEEDTGTTTTTESSPIAFGNIDPNSHISDHLPVSHDEGDKPTDHSSSRTDQAVELNQSNGLSVGSREESSSLRRRGTSNESSIASASQVRATPEPASAARRTPLSASGPERPLAAVFNLLGSITSQQLSSAVAATEQTRRMFSITMSLLVLLCYFGFPIVSNKVMKSVILFRPLLLLMFTNVSLLIVRLLAEFEKGDKDVRKLPGSDGLGWAEAGRALEVGLMLQNVFSSLFMDFSVYALIVVCGFCLAG